MINCNGYAIYYLTYEELRRKSEGIALFQVIYYLTYEELRQEAVPVVGFCGLLLSYL